MLSSTVRLFLNGYPPAALFGFCVALASGNVYAGVKAAVRAAHGAEVAVPEETWAVIGGWSVGQMADWLVGLARRANLRRYRKATRGPKKPRPPRTRFAEAKHIATARLLNGEQTGT